MAFITRRLLPGLLLFQAFYVFGFMAWYSQTAAGLSPVLDGAETLALTQAMIEGNLEREPFYRAMLYPTLLAAGGWLFPDTASLALLARIINALAFILGSWVVFYLARALWQSTRAGLLAWALTGLNPVLLHFAADPIDITVATTLFLLTLLALWQAQAREKIPLYCLAGVLAGLTVLTRPQFFFPAAALPLLVLAARMLIRPDNCKPIRTFVPLTSGLVFVLCLQGVLNLLLSGHWAILPTQGAFNLWAANEPGAHGRYFVQTVALTRADALLNPARREAEIRYRLETGLDARENPAETDRYWRDRTRERILSDPAGWIKQLAWKGYFLVHPHEQYNNKTYSVHKELSPWLRWNPLYWSIVLALGVAGFMLGRRSPFVWIIAGCILAYAAALLLTYVSARFRIPLVPLLALLAGGLATLKRQDLTTQPRRAALTALLGLLIFATGLTSWNQVKDPATRAEDYLLLSQASHELGWEQDAYDWASRSLDVNPSREATRELLVLSHFNLILNGQNAPAPEETEALLAADIRPLPDSLAFPWGTLWWQAGQPGRAFTIWNRALDGATEQDPQIVAALMLTMPQHPVVKLYPTLHYKANWHPSTLAAAALRGDPEADQLLQTRLPPDQAQYLKQSLQRLFLPATGDPAISIP